MASNTGGSSSSVTSYWIKFFTDCGIPPSEAASHAVTFTDHRIQKDMLMDLTKEYLNDMGIAMMGDCIAILKHAKAVHNQVAREKALKGTGFGSASATPPRRSTPASRFVDHYLGKDPEAKPLNDQPPSKMSKELAARLGPSHSRPGTPEMGSKSSVFQRLGQSVPETGPKPPQVTAKVTAKTAPKVTVTGLDKVSLKSQSPAAGSSVFNRLGKSTIKRPATSTVPEDEDDSDVDEVVSNRGSLQYAGVLKASPVKKPKIKVTLQNTTKTTKTEKKPLEQRLGPQKAEPSSTSEGILGQTEGILARHAGHINLPGKLAAKKRLGAHTSAGLGQATKSRTLTVTVPSSKAANVRLGQKGAGIGRRINQPVVTRASSTTSSATDKLAHHKLQSSTVAPGIKSRLGPQKGEVSSSADVKVKGIRRSNQPTGVFSRLGKQMS